MADVVDKKTRSRMMSGIRGKNTKPEVMIRKGLFARGLRYRLHGKGMPGRPDIVLPRHDCLIFVHGCFWHQHDCHLFKWPSTNKQFWRKKLGGNKSRDEKTEQKLLDEGWRVLTIWECSFRGGGWTIDDVIDAAVDWVHSDWICAEIRSSL